MNIPICPDCGSSEHFDEPTIENGEVVRIKRMCRECGKYLSWVPKHEYGIPSRRVAGRSPITPGKRARILERDNYRCALCGYAADDVTLHIGHVISVKDGQRYAISEEQINSEENLVTMCELCNLGLSDESLPLPAVARLYQVRRLRSK